MKSRALTPLFRWLAARTARPARPGSQLFPSATAGNHAGEAGFLGVAVFSLTATGVLPLTEQISSPFLRWPLMVALLFLTPHVAMGLVSLLIPRRDVHPTRQVVLQDYGCLAAMTLYAGWTSIGGGWESTVCLIWLGFVLCNLPFFLWEKYRAGRQPPSHAGT